MAKLQPILLKILKRTGRIDKRLLEDSFGLCEFQAGQTRPWIQAIVSEHLTKKKKHSRTCKGLIAVVEGLTLSPFHVPDACFSWGSAYAYQFLSVMTWGHNR